MSGHQYNPFQNYPPVGINASLGADYIRRDPVTGRMWLDVVGYYLEQLRMTPERSTTSAKDIAAMVPVGIRPLQALEPGQRGKAVVFQTGELQTKGLFRVEPKGDDSELIAVTFGVKKLDESDDEESFFQAKIAWGVGNGDLLEAIVDVIRGTTIHVGCNQLSVAVFRNPSMSDPEILPGHYSISAHASYIGIGHASNPARFTDRLGVIPAGSKAFSEIPAFAIAFTVTQSHGTIGGLPTATPLQIQVMTSFDETSPDIQTYTYDGISNSSIQEEDQFPLMGPARVVEIINQSNAPTFVQIIYSLAL